MSDGQGRLSPPPNEHDHALLRHANLIGAYVATQAGALPADQPEAPSYAASSTAPPAAMPRTPHRDSADADRPRGRRPASGEPAKKPKGSRSRD